MKQKLKKETKKIVTIKKYGPGFIEAMLTAKFLYNEIFKSKRDYLKPSLIYALCSMIEESLNCLLIDFFYSKLGDGYKSYVSIYLKMSIHEKLKIIIPTITEYKFDFNYEKKEIKTIKQLFDIRNQLIHIKNHYYPVLYEIKENGEEYIELLNEKDLNIYADFNFDKLDKKTLLEFHRTQKVFTPVLNGLHNRFKKRNFKVGDWFVLIAK